MQNKCKFKCKINKNDFFFSLEVKTEIQGTDTFQQLYLPVHITNPSLLKYLNITMSNAYMGSRG